MGAAAEEARPAAPQSTRYTAAAPVPVDVPQYPGVKSKINGISISDKAKKQWNTKNLSSRLAADAAAAGTAGVLVAPVITMIDKYA